MNCTFPDIFICLCLCIIFCGISIYKDFSIKFVVIALLIVLYIPIKFNSEAYEQCKIQQRKERIENDKQFLMENLENRQCGDVCIKESDSIHSTKFSHYIMCDVSIRICK